MIKTQHIFPAIQILTALGASIVYFSKGDTRHGIYWAAAAIITAVVTF